MKKIQDIAEIIRVEIDDTLKGVNRQKDARGNWRTLVRLVVSFEIEDNLTDKQKMLYAKLTDEQKALMYRLKRSHKTFKVSNFFNASDILPVPFDTPKGGFSDDEQDIIVAKIKEFLKTINNKSIFTVHTFSVNELCNHSFLYDSITGVLIKERSYLSSGFEDDEERIRTVLANQLQELLNNGEMRT